MTRDEILYGNLKLWQPDEGPRVNMDTVLLAAYVRLRSRVDSSFVELGTAAGAVSLMLALRFTKKFRILGLEIQPELEELAQRNRVENGLEERVSFRRMDLREYRSFSSGSFDGLVVNPPYEEEGRGRRSPVEAISIARQSVSCTLEDVVSAASWLLKNKGRYFAVFRADRMSEFLASMIKGRIEPKRLRLVHPRRGERANLFLVEGLKGGGAGLSVEPPLFVYDDAGGYTPELLKAYELEGLPLCL
jgi:tRNA1(Val) A37 N6-methylase TrmN6